MADRLIVTEEHDGYMVSWLVKDDAGEDIGGSLGDGMSSYGTPVDYEDRYRTSVEAAKTPAQFDELEHYAAHVGAHEVMDKLATDQVIRTTRGYLFYSKKVAAEVCRAAMGEVKALRARAKQVAQGSTAWPTWALQAQAAGWVAPKGWKP